MLCLMAAVLTFTSCSDDDDNNSKLCLVSVQLQFPESAGVTSMDSIEIVMKNVTNSVAFKKKTDAAGLAKFALPEGLYEASASAKRVSGAKVMVYNGLNSNVTVDAYTTTVNLPMEVSQGGSIVI